MKQPKDEAEFEKKQIALFRKSGAWAHHMETTVPGFPDTLAINQIGPVFIEFKYIKEADLPAPFLSLFQSTQPGQMASMLADDRTVDIELWAYFAGGIYKEVVDFAAIDRWAKIKTVDWIASVKRWDYVG